MLRFIFVAAVVAGIRLAKAEEWSGSEVLPWSSVQQGGRGALDWDFPLYPELFLSSWRREERQGKRRIPRSEAVGCGRCWWWRCSRLWWRGASCSFKDSKPVTPWSSLIWRATICFYCLPLLTIMVMEEEEQGRSTNMKPADRVRAYQQMFSWWSDGAPGWLPVFTDTLLLLAEWRPTPFLPASMPYGRQFQLRFGGHVMRSWRFRRAKWFVPGGGEVRSKRWLSRTRSRFLLSVWGPPCKSQGLSCYFLFFIGPVVICDSMLI